MSNMQSGDRMTDYEHYRQQLLELHNKLAKDNHKEQQIMCHRLLEKVTTLAWNEGVEKQKPRKD